MRNRLLDKFFLAPPQANAKSMKKIGLWITDLMSLELKATNYISF